MDDHVGVRPKTSEMSAFATAGNVLDETFYEIIPFTIGNG